MKKVILSAFSVMLLIVVTSTTSNAQSKIKEAKITSVEIAPLNKNEAIAPKVSKKHPVERTSKKESIKRVEGIPKTKAIAQPVSGKVIKKESALPIKAKANK